MSYAGNVHFTGIRTTAAPRSVTNGSGFPG